MARTLSCLTLAPSMLGGILCDHLRCAPPLCPFPRLHDLGQRHIAETCGQPDVVRNREIPKWDRSPWIVEPEQNTWSGIRVVPQAPEGAENWSEADDSCGELDPLRWSARSDTFTGNLALFRPLNVEYNRIGGATIYVRQEELGVRQYSAGALTSHADYLFGRFESTFRASDVPGVITGFFFTATHRIRKLTSKLPATCRRASSSMCSTTQVATATSSTTATEVLRVISSWDSMLPRVSIDMPSNGLRARFDGWWMTYWSTGVFFGIRPRSPTYR